MLQRLPLFRTRAALSEKSAQVEALKADKQQLRARLEELRAQVVQLQARTAEIDRLRDQAAELAALKDAVTQGDGQGAADLLSVVSSRTLERLVATHATGYREASPFPHIVIDDFLEPAVLRRVAHEFAGMDRSAWRRTTRPTERKLSMEDPSRFGPFTRRVVGDLNTGPFLAFLEKLTGIAGLIADPHLRGGGLHEIERGGMLAVHADFNHYERLNLWRRLNLLVYLNTDWQEAWGGYLELWDRDGKACVRRIAPLFNRAVLFDTSNFSYHGHPQPLDVPDGGSRKSLALYYYTVDYPYESDRTPHGTVFIETEPDTSDATKQPLTREVSALPVSECPQPGPAVA